MIQPLRLSGLNTIVLLTALLSASSGVRSQTNVYPIITVVATDAVAAEGTDNTGTFTFSRMGNLSGPVDLSRPLEVAYLVLGTAQNGIDYESIDTLLNGNVPPPGLLGVVRFAAGSATAEVKIVPLDDDAVEGTETVNVRVYLPAFPGAPVPLYIIGDPAAAQVTIEDDDHVPTNLPPVVRLVLPNDGDIFTTPANILLVAQARDEDGEVKTVEFFAGDQSLGIKTNLPVANPLGPFILPWNNVPPGEYTLTAKATDNLSATTVSAPVKIVVRQESMIPVVNIDATDPEASEIPLVPPWLGMPQRIDPGTFTISRCGSTADPLVVRYRIGGSAVNGVDYMEISDTVTIPAGSCFTTVQIWPIDDALVEDRETVILSLVEMIDCDPSTIPGSPCYRIGLHREATVKIQDNDLRPNNPPTVKLLSPPDGAEFTAPASMVLTVLVRDEDGWVEKVEFFAGDRSLGVVGTDALPTLRFYFDWNDVAAGEYSLTARATDNFGATRVSESVHIVVRSAEAAPLVFIPKGAVWKYLDNGSDQGIAWREPSFNDENWPAGPAQLGFGDGDEATVLNLGPTDHRTITYYFRRAFNVSSSGPANLILRLLRDDGAVVYLNGTEVFRSNMPDGPISFQTLALGSVNGDAEHVYYTATVEPSLLKTNASNVIAVEVHQVVASSADLSFDLELLGNVPPPPNQRPSVAIVAPRNGATFIAPVDIPIRAEAADRDGTVKKVEFYTGDRLLGTVETAPYSLTWSNVAPGEYILTAKATDDDNATTTSSGVKVIVLERPPEQTVVNIEATDREAAEISPLVDVPPNPAVFTVRRSGDTNINLTVYYAVGGRAVNGVDYEKLSGEVMIPEGAWSATIVVNPIDDTLSEGTESVVIELKTPVCPAIYPPPPECYRVGEHGRAEAIVLDDDPLPNVPPLVRITRPHQDEVFRAPAEIEIVAVARDIDGWVGRVEFFANERKIGEQEIVFIQPPPPGETQTFSLNWANVPVGEYVLIAKATDDRGGTGRSEPVKIRVLDTTPPPPVVTVVARDCFAREGTNSSGEINTAAFVIRRNDGTNTDLTVFYSTHGTAENGVDYQRLSGSVTIPAGSRSARVVVTPIDDDQRERIETVVLKLEPDPSLGPVARYTIGRPAKAAAIIVDNDMGPPPCLRLPGGLFHLCLPANDGFCFRVESSSDLREWTPVCTTVVTDGAIHFVDAEADEHPNRYYRIAPDIDVNLDE